MSGRKTSRRTILKATGGLGVAGVASLGGCLGNGGGGGYGGGGGDGGETFTIGMANSLTGSLATFGERNERGKQLALAAVNDVGVRGGELRIVVEDTGSQPGPGVSAAQKLVNQNDVPVLIGAVSSGVSLSIYESVVQGTDVDQISQNSTSPELSNFPELLRMSPPGKAQASAIADLVSNDGHDSAAVTFVNNAYGQGVADVFRDAYDGDVPFFQAHDQERSSYSNVVTGMADSGADAWVFVTYQPEFTTIAKEAFDKGHTDVPMYGADSVKGPNVLEQVPDEMLEGMKVVVPSAAVSQDNYKAFAETFDEEFDKQPTSWAAYAYDAIVTAAVAIHAADEFSAGAISNELVKDVTRPEGKKVTTYEAAHDVLADGGSASDLNYEGVSGPIDLNEKGDPAAFLQVFTVRNGKYESTGFTKGGGG